MPDGEKKGGLGGLDMANIKAIATATTTTTRGRQTGRASSQ